MKRNAFLACALVSALVSQRLSAQGVGASGDIKGTVVDFSGAPSISQVRRRFLRCNDAPSEHNCD
jgi:hypothetical protein